MPRKLAALWVLLAALTAGPLPAAAGDMPDDYPFVSYGEGIKRAQAESKPVFVYLSRYGCSTCRKINAESFSDPEVRARYSEHFVLVGIDTESGARVTLPNGERTTEMQLAARFRILGTPTFFFLQPDQQPILKLAGFRTIEQLLAYDRYVSEKHYKTRTLAEFMASE